MRTSSCLVAGARATSARPAPLITRVPHRSKRAPTARRRRAFRRVRCFRPMATTARGENMDVDLRHRISPTSSGLALRSRVAGAVLVHVSSAETAARKILTSVGDLVTTPAGGTARRASSPRGVSFGASSSGHSSSNRAPPKTSSAALPYPSAAQRSQEQTTSSPSRSASMTSCCNSVASGTVSETRSPQRSLSVCHSCPWRLTRSAQTIPSL